MKSKFICAVEYIKSLSIIPTIAFKLIAEQTITYLILDYKTNVPYFEAGDYKIV